MGGETIKKFRLSSVFYIILGAINVLYVFYYIINDFYYHPNSEYYQMHVILYYFVSIPLIYFSITAFVTLVIRDIFKISISRKKMYQIISFLVFLLYLGFLIMVYISGELIFSSMLHLIANILFSIYGIIFTLGMHKNME